MYQFISTIICLWFVIIYHWNGPLWLCGEPSQYVSTLPRQNDASFEFQSMNAEQHCVFAYFFHIFIFESPSYIFLQICAIYKCLTFTHRAQNNVFTMPGCNHLTSPLSVWPDAYIPLDISLVCLTSNIWWGVLRCIETPWHLSPLPMGLVKGVRCQVLCGLYCQGARARGGLLLPDGVPRTSLDSGCIVNIIISSSIYLLPSVYDNDHTLAIVCV